MKYVVYLEHRIKMLRLRHNQYPKIVMLTVKPRRITPSRPPSVFPLRISSKDETDTATLHKQYTHTPTKFTVRHRYLFSTKSRRTCCEKMHERQNWRKVAEISRLGSSLLDADIQRKNSQSSRSTPSPQCKILFVPLSLVKKQ